MRWDAKTKEILHNLLRDKIHQIVRQCNKLPDNERRERREELYNSLLNELGINRVEKVRQPFGRRHWEDPKTKTPARTKDHILIKDPWNAFSKLEHGLKIPKETAMKILVLRTP